MSTSPARLISAETSPSSPTSVTSGESAAAVETPAISVRNTEDVTSAVKALLAWREEFFATENFPEPAARLLELRAIAAKDRASLTPEMIAEGKTLRATYDAAMRDWSAKQDAWFKDRILECPPPAVSFVWGISGGEDLFQAFALALVRMELSGFLQGPQQLTATAWKLWEYCRQDVLYSGREKPTLDGFEALLNECHVDVEPEPIVGPAPDQRLANLVWAAIIKQHAQTGEVVSHADLYARITARQASIREATKWLRASGKIVPGERGGFLPHAEDRE